eukprot:TRINITY_DN1250_c0_g1_i1.p1 TRINITY_DN1250_c0_g1~~TRINITY_DN1250_c0_g1_i1.p1  ORF type:complete len:327 (+),score=-19.78 TRINITY_DN1250_c0_g1_i1:175-1155(+)
MTVYAAPAILPAHSGETVDWQLLRHHHHRRFRDHHRRGRHSFHHSLGHHHLGHPPPQQAALSTPEPSETCLPADNHHHHHHPGHHHHHPGHHRHRGHVSRHAHLAARHRRSLSPAGHDRTQGHHHHHHPGHHHGRQQHHLATRHGRLSLYAAAQGIVLRPGSPELGHLSGSLSHIGHVLERLRLHSPRSRSRSRSLSPAHRDQLRHPRASSVPLSAGDAHPHSGRHGSESPRHRRHYFMASAVHPHMHHRHHGRHLGTTRGGGHAECSPRGPRSQEFRCRSDSAVERADAVSQESEPLGQEMNTHEKVRAEDADADAPPPEERQVL